MKGVELAARCRAFVRRLEEGDWWGGWHLDREAGVYRAGGSPKWAPLFDALLVEAAAAFDSGDFAAAARAYDHLLPALAMRDVFGACAEPVELLKEPIPAHAARWARALYETRPPAQRGQAVALGLHAVSPYAEPVDLNAVVAAREPPPWPKPWRQFQDRLRVALLQLPPDEDAWGRQRGRLMDQLPQTDDEIEAWVERMRELGVDPEQVHRRLVDALVRSGRAPDAIRVASEGARTSGDPRLRAWLADRRARIADRYGLALEVLPARRDAFFAQPNLIRAARLVEAARKAGESALSALLEEAWAADPPLPQHTVAALELGAGQLEIAAARLEEADPVAWHDPEHPGRIVLPALLRLGLGRRLVPHKGVFAQVWRSLRLVDEPDRSHPWGWHPPEGNDPPVDFHPDVVEPLALTRGALEAPWYRGQAAAAVTRMADAAAASQDAYARVARFAVAWAEVETLAGSQAEARRFLAGLEARHPRHRALKRCYRVEAQASPFL